MRKLLTRIMVKVAEDSGRSRDLLTWLENRVKESKVLTNDNIFLQILSSPSPKS